MLKKAARGLLTGLLSLSCGIAVYYFIESWRTGRSTRDLFLEHGWGHQLFLFVVVLLASAFASRVLRDSKRAETPGSG